MHKAAVILVTGDLSRLTRWQGHSLPELTSFGADLFVVPWGNCAPALAELARDFGTVVNQAGTSVETSRNHVIENVLARDYELIGFIDDDAFLQPGWATAVDRALTRNPDVSAFGSHLYCEDPQRPNELGRLQGSGHTFNRGLATDIAPLTRLNIGPTQHSSFRGVCSSCCIIRATAIDHLRIHGSAWDPAFQQFSTCHDFGLRLALLGYRAMRVIDASVLHTGFPSRRLSNTIVENRLVAFLRSNLLLFKKFLHPPDNAKAQAQMQAKCSAWSSRGMWHPFQEIPGARVMPAFTDAKEQADRLEVQSMTFWQTFAPVQSAELLDVDRP